MKIQSTKVYDGFSTCFRQWKAEGTHCRFTHGYSVHFKVWFEGEMDEKNWVMDFGRAKRSSVLIEEKKLDEFLKWLLDHTVIIAEDDPFLETFKELDEKGVIQLRVFPQVGAERFAVFLFKLLNQWCIKDTHGRVIVKKIEFFEHSKNSAIVEGEDKDYEELFEKQKLAHNDEDLTFASLYEFLGYAAGSKIGKAVAEAAAKEGIPVNKQSIPSTTGFNQVYIYPVSFLKKYFNKQ